jgi:hypothetical protein
MDTERYCAYNTTRDCFLSSEVTLIDTALDPLRALKVLVEGLAEGAEAGLWLMPLANIPMVPRISPFDIVYLDKNHQITQAVELLPGVEFPSFDSRSASALVLPLHTISSTHTVRGDSVRICIDREIAADSGSAKAASERSPVMQAPLFSGHSITSSSEAEQVAEVTSFQKLKQTPARTEFPDPLSEVAEAESPSVMWLFRQSGSMSKQKTSSTAPIEVEATFPFPTRSQPASASSTSRASEPRVMTLNGVPIAHQLAPREIATLDEVATLDEGPPPAVMDEVEAAERFGATRWTTEAQRDLSAVQDAESTTEESGPDIVSAEAQVQSPQIESEQGVPGAAKPSREGRIFGLFKHSRVAIAPVAEVANGIARAATRQSLMAQLKRWFEPEVAPSDRRGSNRRQVPSMVAYYWTGGAPKAHRVIDISESGLYVVTEDRWVPETMIQMTLQKRSNNGQRKVSMSVLARVVRSGREGVGAEFVMSETLDLQTREMLGARGTDRRTLGRFLQ